VKRLISYPILTKGVTIGVTAPSSGVEEQLHAILKDACHRMEEKGYKIECGETAWKQYKAESAPAKQRAVEFNGMMEDERIQMIIPPWGGELLIEVLPYIDYENLKQKWILGYSDTSLLLLAITLKTGIATAHGTNLVDLRGEYWDETTAMWETVLSTPMGESVLQQSSLKFQKEWKHDQPSPCVFHLTEKTSWKCTDPGKIVIKGRLLGGCVDVIHHLVGTPYGDVGSFRQQHVNDEPIVWFFENCEQTVTDLKRSLLQMKMAGWFDHCSGIMFGRSEANHVVEGYTVLDMYGELAEELGIPIVYDIDCGHVPPQITLVNGAFAEVEVENGKGFIRQRFI